MNNISKILLLIAFAALNPTLSDSTASDITRDSKPPHPNPRFLEPFNFRAFAPRTDPRYESECRRRITSGGSTSAGSTIGRCAPVLNFGGNRNRGIPTIEPAFQANLPHVRVSFVIQESRHEQLDAENFATLTPRTVFRTDSPAADVQEGVRTVATFPAPGDTEEISRLVYDAIIFNACGTDISFPVTHSASCVAETTFIITADSSETPISTRLTLPLSTIFDMRSR